MTTHFAPHDRDISRSSGATPPQGYHPAPGAGYPNVPVSPYAQVPPYAPPQLPYPADPWGRERRSSKPLIAAAVAASAVALVGVGVGIGVSHQGSQPETPVQAGHSVPELPTFTLPPFPNDPSHPVVSLPDVSGLPFGTGDPAAVPNIFGGIEVAGQFASGGKVCTVGAVVKNSDGKLFVLTARQCVGPVDSPVYVMDGTSLSEVGAVASAGNAAGLVDIRIKENLYFPGIPPISSGSASDKVANPDTEAIGEVGAVVVRGKTVIVKLDSKENGNLIYRNVDTSSPGPLTGADSGAPVYWAENNISFQPVLVGIVTDGSRADHIVVAPVQSFMQDYHLSMAH